MSDILGLFSNTTVDQIVEQIKEDNKSGSGNFEPLLRNEYKVTPKADGSGGVIMRILPALHTFKNQFPHVKVRRHFINHKGVVYDSLCPGFFSEDCPICKFRREENIFRRDNNSPFKEYNNGKWEDRKMVIPRLRESEETWVNVLIINDMVDPMNNGKIFQYKLPYDIIAKYMALIDGDPAIGRKPTDPSHPLTGRNLYVKYMMKDGFRNYEQSEFLDQSPITNIAGENLTQTPDFGKQLQEELQDLYELIDPETRMYTPEQAQEKWNQLFAIIEEEVHGGASTSRIEDGFNTVALKPSVNKNEASVKVMEEASSGKFDSNKSTEQEMGELMESINESTSKGTSSDDIDDLLAEFDL